MVACLDTMAATRAAAYCPVGGGLVTCSWLRLAETVISRGWGRRFGFDAGVLLIRSVAGGVALQAPSAFDPSMPWAASGQDSASGANRAVVWLKGDQGVDD
jgi:hypothetical protein